MELQLPLTLSVEGSGLIGDKWEAQGCFVPELWGRISSGQRGFSLRVLGAPGLGSQQVGGLKPPPKPCASVGRALPTPRNPVPANGMCFADPPFPLDVAGTWFLWSLLWGALQGTSHPTSLPAWASSSASQAPFPCTSQTESVPCAGSLGPAGSSDSRSPCSGGSREAVLPELPVCPHPHLSSYKGAIHWSRAHPSDLGLAR